MTIVLTIGMLVGQGLAPPARARPYAGGYLSVGHDSLADGLSVVHRSKRPPSFRPVSIAREDVNSVHESFTA